MDITASIENMDDLNASLGSCQEGAESCFGEVAVSLDRLSEAADTELTSATQAIEEAEENVSKCENLVESLENSLDNADDNDKGAIESELAAAQEELDEAKAVLEVCQSRREKVATIVRNIRELRENFMQHGMTSLNRIADINEECRNRMRQACTALEKYLSEHPDSKATAFSNWIRWQPSSSQFVKPDIIIERLKQSSEMLEQFIDYEMTRDPAFRAKIDSYRQQFAAAKTLTERKNVLTQAYRNGSGELAERFVAAAFRPLGDVSTQGRTYFEDGRFTKTDLIVQNLRVPVQLGRGKRVYAPKGGSIAIEVKAGKAPYLLSQAEHLEFQAGGHQEADASVTICTRDIHDLSPENERELRDRLHAAGSPLIGMLPKKSDIDHAIKEAIRRGFGKECI